MVTHSLLQPQEIEVFYILPTVRRELAVQMKLKGFKQTKIAELLHVENASISQYLNEKRGNKVELGEDVKKEIAVSAGKITSALTFIAEMQHLLRFIRSSGTLCQIHKQLSQVPEECNPCLVNCFGDNDGHARICY